MARKIRRSELVRIIAEACRQFLTEEEISGGQEPAAYTPIDIHPYCKGGKWRLYVTFSDNNNNQEVLRSVSDFVSDMLLNKIALKYPAINKEVAKIPTIEEKYQKLEELKNDLVKNETRLNKLLSSEEIDNIKKQYGLNSDLNLVNHSIKEISVSVAIDKPSSLFKKNGDINTESPDIKRIKMMLVWIRNKLRYNHLSFGDIDAEVARGARSVARKVKSDNLINTKEVTDRLDEDTKRLFFEICQDIGQHRAVDLFNRVKLGEEYITGHSFSDGNVVRIMAQARRYDEENPSANQVNTISFLATERQWAAMGREVVDDSYPYYTVTKNNGKVPEKPAINLAQSQGQNFLSLNVGGQLTHQEKQGLTAKTNSVLGNIGKFSYNSPSYDVSATQVINGAIDRFETEYGLKDNIRGRDNAVAAREKENLGMSSNEVNVINSDAAKDFSNIRLLYNAIYELAADKKALNGMSRLGNNGNMNDASDAEYIRGYDALLRNLILKKLTSFEKKGGNIVGEKNKLIPLLVNTGTLLAELMLRLPSPSYQEYSLGDDLQKSDIFGVLSDHVASMVGNIRRRAEKILEANNAITGMNNETNAQNNR